MNTSFGPWSTAITTGANHQLSTFWKRRLAMLASIHNLPSRAARRTWILLALAATLALMWPTIHAAPPTEASRDSVGQRLAGVEFLPRPSPAEAKILRALELPIDVDFSETPFEECLNVLGKSAEIRLVADEARLAEEGFALDAPVTLKLSGKPLEVVLHRLLKLMEQDQGNRKVAPVFLVDDNEIKITTEELAYELVDHWYPVWDLHRKSGDATSTLYPYYGSRRTEPPAEIGELIQVATSSIQADSWEELSGPGSIQYVGELDCLIVRQTQAVHREFVKLLRLWREARSLKRAAASEDVPRAKN